MNYRGTILKLKEKKAIVMTEECDFLSIKRRSGMSLGQQITFQESDIIRYNRKNVKYFMVAASILLIFLISVSYFHYTANSAYAYVDIDINPSLELVINKQERVLKTIPLNEDARFLSKGLTLNGMTVQNALAQIIVRSKEQGYLDVQNENDILISVALNMDGKDYTPLKDKAEERLENLIGSLRGTVNDLAALKVKALILKITPEKRKHSQENNISMGRYFIYTQMKEKGVDVTIEEIKKSRVSEILNKMPGDNAGNKKRERGRPESDGDLFEKTGKKTDERNINQGNIKKINSGLDMEGKKLKDTGVKDEQKYKPGRNNEVISEKADKAKDILKDNFGDDDDKKNDDVIEKRDDTLEDEDEDNTDSDRDFTGKDEDRPIDIEDQKSIYPFTGYDIYF